MLHYTRQAVAGHPEASTWDIGEKTYGAPEVWSWNEGSRLIIGNYTSIASGVVIYLGGNHHTDWVTSYPLRCSDPSFRIPDEEVLKPKDVVIGNDVWIGGKVMIMSGVNIGHGAVIGAGSVVSSDIPPYAIAVGNTARVVKYRFTEQQIADLLEIKWWDWPLDEIERHGAKFLSRDMDGFIKFAKSRNSQ